LAESWQFVACASCDGTIIGHSLVEPQFLDP
jgi:hypothetical protein